MKDCQQDPATSTCSEVEDKEGIEDRTETNLINLRRVIYLTIMNAVCSYSRVEVQTDAISHS